MDIRKYFENINKDILYEILKRKITDEKLLWLIREIIYSKVLDIKEMVSFVRRTLRKYVSARQVLVEN